MEYLTDLIDFNLGVLFIGFNPGLKSAEMGHHYAGNNNRFWRLLFESGITPYKFSPEEDFKLLEIGCGSTNIVSRPSRGASELKLAEFREGAITLRSLLEKYRPKIACYVGIGVYKIFTGKSVVACGLQDISTVEGISDYVCSSPSGLNRVPYSEQLKCFKGLKRIMLNKGQ